MNILNKDEELNSELQKGTFLDKLNKKKNILMNTLNDLKNDDIKSKNYSKNKNLENTSFNKYIHNYELKKNKNNNGFSNNDCKGLFDKMKDKVFK